MKGLDAIKEMLKNRYCRGVNTECARYRVFKALGKAHVPDDLPPNDQERAGLILAAANVSVAGRRVLAASCPMRYMKRLHAPCCPSTAVFYTQIFLLM